MKRLFSLAQKAMSMDDATWARHANPWSVYSRMTLLPLIALAVWSRVWIGWWALVRIALCLLWAWLNPRLFPPPDHRDSWAVHGTLGERPFMAEEDSEVAAHHRRAVAWLTVGNAIGTVVMTWGLVVLIPWITLCGLTATMGAKLWTFDRMVWLYREGERPAGGPHP